MSDDISVLGIAVEQRGVKEGTAALDKLAAAGKKAEQSTDGLTGASKKATFEISALAKVAATALAGYSIAGMASEYIKTADAMSLMNARLRLVTSSQSEFAAVQAGIVALSKENRAGIDEMSALYVRLAAPVKAAGGGMVETMKIVDSFSKSLKLGGASATEAAAATLQFAQAMGSGKLSGDEFRSLAEASPRFMQAIADGIGKPVGALKELASEGGLTADVVGNALMKMNAQLSSEFQSLPGTVGDAMTQVRNEIKLAVAEIDKTGQFSSSLAAQINSLAQSIGPMGSKLADGMSGASASLEENKRLVIELAAVYAAAKFGANFGPLIAQSISAAAAQAQLSAAVLSGNAVMLGGKVAAEQKAAANALAAKSAMELAAAELAAARNQQAALVAAREAAVVRLSEANATVKATAAMGAYSAALAANARAIAAKSAALAELAMIGRAVTTINAQLAASEAAAAAASAAHATAATTLASATAAASISGRASSMAMAALSGTVAALGGPIGVVITLLGAGATAWALWGNNGKEAARSIADELANARGELEKLEKARKFGPGALGDARANLKSAEDRLNTYLGGPTSKAVLRDAYKLVEDRQRIVDELESQNNQISGGATTKPLTGKDALKAYLDDLSNAARSTKVAAEVEKENKAFKAAVESLKKTDADYTQALAKATAAHNERIAEITKEPKGSGGGSDGIANATLSFDLARIKRESDQLAAIYAGSERIIEANHAAGLMSDKEYYEAKAAFIRLNAEAQESALQQEIERLASEKVSGKERIDNLQKIADAQAQIDKIRLEAGFSTAINGTQEEAAIRKVAQAYESARASAQSYIDTIKLQSAREIAGYGMGAEYRKEQGDQNRIEDKFLSRRSSLDEQKRAGQITQEAYDEYLSIARKTYEEEVAIHATTREAILGKQADWSVGASEALANYLEETRNVAKQTESLFANAFQSAEDAFVEFAKTGKLSFSDLADSIIADLARMAYKSAMGPLTELLGGMIGSLFIVDGARASGGSVSSGGTYLVGERGPELLTMGGNGYITPNNALGSNVVVNLVESPGSGRGGSTSTSTGSNGEQIITVLVEKIKGDLIKDVGSGGSFASAMEGQYSLNRSAAAWR